MFIKVGPQAVQSNHVRAFKSFVLVYCLVGNWIYIMDSDSILIHPPQKLEKGIGTKIPHVFLQPSKISLTSAEYVIICHLKNHQILTGHCDLFPQRVDHRFRAWPAAPLPSQRNLCPGGHRPWTLAFTKLSRQGPWAWGFCRPGNLMWLKKSVNMVSY